MLKVKSPMEQGTTTQLALLADVVPNDRGGFTIVPKRPIQEITTKEAARLLGMSPRSVCNLVNHPKASRILRWRWQSERQGKRMFDLASVLEYRKASQDPEFGESEQ